MTPGVHLDLSGLLLASIATICSNVAHTAVTDVPAATQALAPLPQPSDSTATSATPFVLTLDRAMERTLDKHPDLQLFEYTEKTLRADADIASQHPPINAGLRMQNALGNNETTGF